MADMWIYVLIIQLSFLYIIKQQGCAFMSFTIEFQPVGIRLVSEEPVTILEAARQAGIYLRSDCGGAGICGKCQVQIVEQNSAIPCSESDQRHLNPKQLSDGFRLACAFILNQDTKIFIPTESMPAGQVLQTSSDNLSLQPDPILHQTSLQLAPASLHDLTADFERIRQASVNDQLTAELDILRLISNELRANNWHIHLIQRNNHIQHISPKPCQPLAGLAVDVGSTKLACYLVDLDNGKLLAAKGVPNPQMMFGEDIMARLAYAQKGQQQALQLHEMVIRAIQQAVSDMCGQIEIPVETIADACLVGNTVMHHFFLGLPSGTLAVSPFTPVISSALYPAADQIGLAGMPGMGVYAPPVIAGFVGSDHLAFLMACGFGQDERVRLGIDIGTNTEIALQKGRRIVSVSTASGPAFEGAHIRYGMRAAPGAIEHVRIRTNGQITCDTIGNKPPTGICGSGILDAVVEMRTAGLLNQRGRLNKDNPLVRPDDQGKPCIVLCKNEEAGKLITLSQNDIDQVLLAKGAIRAGIDVLMDYLDIQPDQFEEVLIAGAFGSFMLPEQAIRIGMLPQIPLQHIRAVGNAAGLGARMMLISQTARQQAESLARRIEYLELTLYPDFELFYARGIQA
jgi:uncharacterized 2Fe-2S/4Fe-4S cluster protein (DUF4445 family)